MENVTDCIAKVRAVVLVNSASLHCLGMPVLCLPTFMILIAGNVHRNHTSADQESSTFWHTTQAFTRVCEVST